MGAKVDKNCNDIPKYFCDEHTMRDLDWMGDLTKIFAIDVKRAMRFDEHHLFNANKIPICYFCKTITLITGNKTILIALLSWSRLPSFTPYCYKRKKWKVSTLTGSTIRKNTVRFIRSRSWSLSLSRMLSGSNVNLRSSNGTIWACTSSSLRRLKLFSFVIKIAGCASQSLSR